VSAVIKHSSWRDLPTGTGANKFSVMLQQDRYQCPAFRRSRK
jgi:hypothetical protein